MGRLDGFDKEFRKRSVEKPTSIRILFWEEIYFNISPSNQYSLKEIKIDLHDLLVRFFLIGKPQYFKNRQKYPQSENINGKFVNKRQN